MATTVEYSLLEGQVVTDSVDGQLIVLPCKVIGFPVAGMSAGSGDTKVLTKIRSFLPALLSPHPDVDNFPNATLRDVVVRSIKSVNVVHVDLIYKALGISQFTLEEITQTEYLKTFTFGDGSKNIDVWYKPGADKTLIVPPAGLSRKQKYSTDVQRFYGKRILKATGWMKYADWKAIRPKIRAARWYTNFTQWGDDPIEDATGCWLFQNMRTWTNDLNVTKAIELYFLNDPGGHYPISGWIDEMGNHPSDGDGTTEQDLRAKGPPPLVSTSAGIIFRAVRGAWQMNGISRTAVYKETLFDVLFNFDPSQA